MKKRSPPFDENIQDLLGTKIVDNPKCPPITSLVYIRYRDHLLFKATDPEHLAPIERECVGWLEKESSDAVCLLWDRSVIKLLNEIIYPQGSGLVILKSDILELTQIEL